MESLPADLIFHLLRYFGSLEVLACFRSCKSLHQKILQNLGPWKLFDDCNVTIYAPHSPSRVILLAPFGYRRIEIEIRFHAKSETFFEGRILRTNMDRVKATTWALQEVGRRFEIRKICFSSTFSLQYLEALDYYRRVEAIEADDFTGDAVLPLLQKFPNLEYFSISNKPCLRKEHTDFGDAELLHYRKLTMLILGCMRTEVTLEGIFELINSGRPFSLLELSVRKTDQIPFASIQQLARKIKTLDATKSIESKIVDGDTHWEFRLTKTER